MARQLYHRPRQATGAPTRPGVPGSRRGSSCAGSCRGPASTLGEQRQPTTPSSHDRGRVRRRRDRGPARAPPLSRLRRPAQPQLHPLLVEEAPPLLDVDSVIAHRDRGALPRRREPADSPPPPAGASMSVSSRSPNGREVLSPERRHARRRSHRPRATTRLGQSVTTGSSANSTISARCSPPDPS
jgi:hypothetical protein